MDKIVLGIAVSGLILVTLYALWLRFQIWQIRRFFKMFTMPVSVDENKSGGGSGFFTIMALLFVLIMLGLFLAG